MKKTFLWIMALATIACAPAEQATVPSPEGGTSAAAEPAPAAEPVAMTETYPDPDAEMAAQVQGFVSDWVAERAGDDGIYAIPPRGGREVSGARADFHTVHQKDADTYSVCVDFASGEQLYDVDFFVDRTESGLVLADHYLHKIDGEPVE